MWKNKADLANHLGMFIAFLAGCFLVRGTTVFCKINFNGRPKRRCTERVELLLRDQEVLAAVLNRYTEYLTDVICGFLLSVLANSTRVRAASSNIVCGSVYIIH